MKLRRSPAPTDPHEGRGRTAVVTGASSGIGRAMTRVLAARGYDVFAVARRTDRLRSLSAELEPLHGVRVVPVTADLAVPGAANTILQTVVDDGRHVDLLVNNAGFHPDGAFATTPWVDHERVLQVHATATLQLTHLVLPGMLERRWGRILNTGSIGGLMAGPPNLALYSSSKELIFRFTESLAAETRGTGVHCTVSVPGFTRTEIFEHSGAQEAVEGNPLMRLALMEPEVVAQQAYDAVMRGRVSIVHGRHHKVLATALMHAPAPVRRRLAVIATDIGS